MKDMDELRYFLGIKIIFTRPVQSCPPNLIVSWTYCSNLECWVATCNRSYDCAWSQLQDAKPTLVSLSADYNLTQHRHIIISLIKLMVSHPTSSPKSCNEHLDCNKQVLFRWRDNVDIGIFYEVGLPIQLEGNMNINQVRELNKFVIEIRFCFLLGKLRVEVA